MNDLDELLEELRDALLREVRFAFLGRPLNLDHVFADLLHGAPPSSCYLHTRRVGDSIQCHLVIVPESLLAIETFWWEPSS